MLFQIREAVGIGPLDSVAAHEGFADGAFKRLLPFLLRGARHPEKAEKEKQQDGHGKQQGT